MHPRRYRFTSPLKSYLYVLGRSRAIDWLRRAKRAATVPLEAVENELSTDVSPETAAEETERSRALHAAVDALPEDMRRAVTLLYFEEMSYKEIAAVLGRTTKQVDNLLTRAKTRLRGVLQEGGYES